MALLSVYVDDETMAALERAAKELGASPEWCADEAHIIQVTICEEAAIVRSALTAPHVLMKPSFYPDGNQWCALLGDNIQDGVAGFGDTPELAAADFDKAWRERRLPTSCKTCGDVFLAEPTDCRADSCPYPLKPIA